MQPWGIKYNLRLQQFSLGHIGDYLVTNSIAMDVHIPVQSDDNYDDNSYTELHIL